VNDVLINGLAIIGAVSCVIWAVKALKTLIGKSEVLPEVDADAASAVPDSGDLAAITAVVYAIVGPHRIVGIEMEEPASADLAAITAAVYAVVGPHRIVGIEGSEAANDDLAAITAAVYAVMGAPHRIVHIEKPSEASPWAAEGRWMHQTSHRLHSSRT